MNTLRNLKKLECFIADHNISDDEILAANATPWSAEIHLKPGAFNRLPLSDVAIGEYQVGENVHRRCRIDGIDIVAVFRCKLIVIEE